MKVEQITVNKKRYLDLLLLADEQEGMIDRYLDDGWMFALYDDDLKSIAVVVDLGGRECELKNLATYPSEQRKGYGAKLVDYLFRHYAGDFDTMYVGTGDVPTSTRFYTKCGFEPSHRLENFFTDHYDHPIWEDGVQLVDMVYFKKDLRNMPI